MIISALLVFACEIKNKEEFDHPLAANEEVARYMENFVGRGDLTDPGAQPTKPSETVNRFTLPDDLQIELVLAEPQIVQPIHMSFDHKGRLWVVQYHQYPYPKGLKITDIDNHTRVKFDKSPLAPPEGVQGADKVSVFEDCNGDGHFEHSFDAITGLNIATSVALGRGKIWVLNPPYLLAYPDSIGDGKPTGNPEVHLDGFGLEDTHAIANSLQWGPDGWLYGVQGSTTTANIRATNSDPVSFLGQAIWRYQPDDQVFELFAEGGGNNPFYLEFDKKGRIFSGSNGYGRGPYYKQGGYYIKSWGKHGPLTNPYAFGFLPNMPLDGEKKRFTHATMVYEGGQLPKKYEGKIMALNPLHNYIQLSRMEKSGSSFATIDENTLVETNDNWFRPVDIKTGPDGAVYIADWYDSRLSHVDPKDTWHKSSGRIYRISKIGSAGVPADFNFSEMDNNTLINCLSHSNKWYRQQALRQFADRKDPSSLPPLNQLFEKGNDQEALEALWAINLSGGLNDDFASTALNHHDPFVRMWTIRLLADKKEVSPAISEALIHQARVEEDLEVRSQLAASAKRLPGAVALPITSNLNLYHEDSGDPDIPLQIWWALESKVEKDLDGILQIFRDRNNWMRPLVEKHLIHRLMQRLVMDEKYEAAEALLELAPDGKHALILVEGFYEGIGGKDLIHLPESLVNAIQAYSDDYSSLALSLRSGDRRDLETAIKILNDENEAIGKQLTLIHLFGEIQEPAIVPVLLEIATASKSATSLKQASLHALSAYPSPEIGEQLAKAYPNIRADEYVREAAIRLFSSRKDWAKAFLSEITDSKIIHKEDVPYELARNFLLLKDGSIDQKVGQLWPSTLPLSAEGKTEEFNEVKELILSSSGDAVKGKSLFTLHCGKCHRLGNAGGGTIGPDLTGYDRSQLNYWLLHTIDPNADIREGYETLEVTTANGRMIMGKLEKEDGGILQLSDPFGARGITISENQVKSLQISNISLMPEGLLRKMEEEEKKNLFAFLLNQDNR